MANTERKPMPTIGVKRYTFFPVKEDTATGTVYGEAYHLRGAVEITPTDSGGSDTFDADNEAYVVETYLENMGHDITNADIPPEVDAKWRGLASNNGIVEVSAITDAPYFAVAWEVTKPGNKSRYVRYYKGKYSFASNVGGKTKPSSGASEKQTAKASYTAEQRESDGLYYGYIDEEDIPAGITKAEFEEKWFSDPNYYPTV